MLEDVIKQIKEARTPITIELDSSDIGDAEVELLSDAIKEARAPITLDLASNRIGATGLRSLADAMKETQYELNLCLTDNSIRAEGAGLLAEGIKEAKVPLTVGLGDNSIENTGAELLAPAVGNVRLPLDIGLNTNNIGVAGIGFMAEAIKQARGALILGLGDNIIGDAGVDLLADAIKEMQIPLYLCLRNNLIEENGIRSLVEAIKQSRSPLTLDLSGNNIKIASVKLLVDALNLAKAPFSLNVRKSSVENIGRELLDKAIKNNFVVEARREPSRFLERTGFNLCEKMLERVLRYPSVIAMLITSYISDGDLAWAEVVSIRAVEGASFENKYSSINVALLNTAYFDTSVPVQSSESIKEEGNYTSSADKNTDSGRGSESSSSSSKSSVPPGDSEPHSEMLSNQYSIDLQYGSYNHQQRIDNGKGHDAESLLTRFFAWIKDLPKILQQQILSSFSMQRVLGVLEEVTGSNKFIVDQVGSKQVEEIFATKYQSHYEQYGFADSSTKYAQMNQDNIIGFIE